MENPTSIISVLPPLLVLVIGYLTHRVLLSLSCGILISALIANDYHIWPSMIEIFHVLWINLVQPSNLHIFIFLIFLGIVIVMLQYSGGAYAYTQFAKRKANTKKGAETSSLILSSALFLDDYLSSLTVGAVMQPLTDAKKIPRVKLAFLVDSMSVPFAIFCPFSGWVAAVIGFLSDNGISTKITKQTLINAQPFATYLHILPYLFYSFILVASTWFIVRRKISFGLMKRHEELAAKTGDLFGGHKPKYANKNIEHNPQHTTLLEFFFPIAILLISVIIAMAQFKTAATGLMVGGFVTVVICMGFFTLRKRIKFKELPEICTESFKLMYSCVIVLLFAWSFGDFLRDDLRTGEYLADLMLHFIDLSFLPMIIFFTATLISFTIGSAWGSAAMLFPIVIPLVLSMTNAPELPTLTQIPLLFPALGAVLSGCIAGNHISPIADTTIMATLSTRANLKDHVYTQLQYAISGIILTGICFWLSGLLIQYGLLAATIIPVTFAIGANCLILRILQLKK